MMTTTVGMLHVGRPNIGNRERLLMRINDILDSKWLTNAGRYVDEFEQRVAAIVGVKHCVATCNGTIALENAIRALRLSGEVIVPSFTFIATTNALQWQEITPVFCDIDPKTHCLDPAQVERMITPRTSGIIGVHLWGRPCDVEALAEIAQRRQLKLMFDASHAFGCSYNGEMVGSAGECEVFSFHATKFVNTLEGGAVVTNNGDLAKRLRLMKNFGFTGYDEVEYLGVNGKMNEFSAAMGLTNLESMEEFIAANRRNYHQYRAELSGFPGIRLLEYDEKERCNYQYIVVEVDEEAAGVSRDEIMQALWDHNVLARRYFYPGCHRMEPYRSLFPHAGLLLPETETLAARVLVLPTGTAVDRLAVAQVCGIVRFCTQNAEQVRATMAPVSA